MNKAEQIFNQFCDDKTLRNEFSHLASNLHAHGYITETSLRTLIFEPFKSTQMTNVQKNRILLQAAFKSDVEHFNSNIK